MFSTHAAQTRVLEIPELLDMIFGYLEPCFNASNASVCKRWSEIALDTLWRDLDDLPRLFGLLKPLRPSGESPDSPQVFITPPDAGDWTRLEKYSRRIRCLTHRPDQCTVSLCPTVFEDVARTRTTLNILPNMKSLVWHDLPALGVIFMQSTVTHFSFLIPNEYAEPDAALPTFRDITSRMPHLLTLDLRSHIPMHDMEDNILFLLRGLPKLRKVVFPRFSITTRVAQTLQHHENLGCIEFQYELNQGCGDPQDTEVFAPTLKQGGFPSLYDLSLTCTVQDLTTFMGQPSAPTNLTALYVDSRLVESPTAIHELLTVLVESCQLLESLGIITLIEYSEWSRSLAHIPMTDRVNYSTLRPVQNFPNLTIFEITHQYPLDLTLEDLEQLARSWPSLRKLILNNEPLVCNEPSSLTLKALIPFAQYCPELEQLGLFINASTADLPSTYQVDPPPSYQCKPFGKLRRLSMGVSFVSDPGAVALFLSQICPLKTSIESGVTWDTSGEEEHPLFEAVVDRCSRWAKVDELLPLLTKLRMEERERTKVLLTEVKDLRMRSGVLMDKIGLNGGQAVDSDRCVTV
ncbi:hypothetical protein R3P38DRAFT_2700446 [Favolaschia claudopus]|uniref:F-box domain-containing protein n=1 Tax=Favolaschia claudopus TaxID=2862362 RepID=A0AAW0C1S9_9AGAR